MDWGMRLYQNGMGHITIADVGKTPLRWVKTVDGKKGEEWERKKL